MPKACSQGGYEVHPKDVFAYVGFTPTEELKRYVTDNGGKLFRGAIHPDVTHLIIKKKGKRKTKKELKADEVGIKKVPLADMLPAKDCKSGNTGTAVYRGPLLLAKNYKKQDGSNVVNPAGWWASEKLDGYRALWNGREFLSRTGHQIVVPKWFSELMPPSVALDGELWMGRGKFRECGLFRRKVACPETWAQSNVMFSVFDMPSSQKVFEERMKDLKAVVESRCDCMVELNLPKVVFTIRCPIEIAEQVQVRNAAHLEKMFDDVVAVNGEGIMIRKPKSKYEAKRSSTLLKYKATYDTECEIIGYKAGTGKYKGLLGAFKCLLLDGKKSPIPFHVAGMTDKIRKNYKRTHPVGQVITILYNDVDPESGIPRHPRYLRKKEDL